MSVSYLMKNRDFSHAHNYYVDAEENTALVVSISGKGLTKTIKKLLVSKKKLHFNADKMDNTMKKLADASRLNGDILRS